MEAVFPGVIEANHVTARIEQPCFPPQPPLIAWFLQKAKSLRLQLRDLLVERCALEIDNGAGGRSRRTDRMHREGGVTHGGLEAGVMRAVDDDFKAHRSVERDRGSHIEDRKRDLVQVHESNETEPLAGRLARKLMAV